jgi:integrase
MRRALPKLGIPFFSLHKLRHFFASYSHELGYSDAVIQAIGGWETDHVMKSVYRHAMNKDQAKKNIAADFNL